MNAVSPAIARERMHPWIPTGLFRKQSAERLGHYSLDESISMSSTHKTQPTHDPYTGGWLMQPPSGHWILENGRPKCIPSVQSTSKRSPPLGSKSHSKQNEKTTLAERTVQDLPQAQSMEGLQEPPFDPEVAQQHGSEFMSAGPLAVSPDTSKQPRGSESMSAGPLEDSPDTSGLDTSKNSGISTLAASCRRKQLVHIRSSGRRNSGLLFTPLQAQQKRKSSLALQTHQKWKSFLGSDDVPTAEKTAVDTLDEILKPLDTAPSEVAKLPRFNWEVEFDPKKRRNTASLGRNLPRVPHTPCRTKTDFQLGEKTNLTKASIAATGHGDLATLSPRSASDLNESEKPADWESTEVDLSPKELKHLGLSADRKTSTSTRRLSLNLASHTQRQQKELKDRAARKQDREIRSQMKLLRDSLHRSVTETFEPEIWQGCGIHSDHLKKHVVSTFLGMSLTQKADDDTEASSSAAGDAEADG